MREVSNEINSATNSIAFQRFTNTNPGVKLHCHGERPEGAWPSHTISCHCEERSDVAIHRCERSAAISTFLRDCFAPKGLAMTSKRIFFAPPDDTGIIAFVLVVFLSPKKLFLINARIYIQSSGEALSKISA